MKTFLATTLICSALLLGCQSTPYVRPAAALPDAFPHATAASEAERIGEWWLLFGDPGLDAVVERVIAHNHDLAAATLLLQRARLQSTLAGADRWPRLDGSIGLRADHDDGETRRNAALSLGVSYEVDLWNRLGAAASAAAWEAAATEADLEATAIGLVATTVDTWLQLALLEQRLALGAQSLSATERTLELVESQYRAGAVSGLEVAEATQSLQSQAAAQRQFELQRVDLRNALALLMGQAQWDASLQPASLDALTLPPVSPGVPAELVSQRPDLRAAERRLRALLAGTDAARANLYPRLTLNGGAGSGSDRITGLLDNPVLSLAAGITLPFLDWRRLKLSERISEIDFERAVVLFRQSLLQAYQEVDGALASATLLAQRQQHLVQALLAARDAERISEVRYRAGATALRSWLDAQERLRNAELSVAQGRLEQLQNSVLLFLALGGSWDGSTSTP